MFWISATVQYLAVACPPQGSHHFPGPPQPSLPHMLSPHRVSPHTFQHPGYLQLGGPLQGLHAHMDAVIAHPLLCGLDIDFKLQVRSPGQRCACAH